MSDNLDYTAEKHGLQAPISLLGELISSAQAQPLDLKEYLERPEEGDAALFAQMFQGKVIYDHASREWYIWNGCHWRQDKTRDVAELVSRKLAGEYTAAAAAAQKAGNKDEYTLFSKRGKVLMSRSKIENVLWQAAGKQGMKLEGQEWDTNPLLLGVANGTVNLATGELTQGSPENYIKSYSPVQWMGLEYPCPIWEQTISEIHNGDPEIIAFIQRLYGYALTGLTIERKMVILHGGGSNGKSTEIETVAKVLGSDLATATPADSLMESKYSNGAGPNPFLHALRGKRLIFAAESKEGQRINAGLFKLLSGGVDSITTRTLNAEPVTFGSTWQGFLVTNHLPHASADDQALWDRILKIPYDVRFVNDPKAETERKKDPMLAHALENELPGILAWLVRGCLAWQSEGLNPPAQVLKETDDYRREEDYLADFIEDCLTVGSDQSATAKELYAAYVKWCEQNNETSPMKKTGFGRKMGAKFIKPDPKDKTRTYKGVGVLQ